MHINSKVKVVLNGTCDASHALGVPMHSADNN